MPNLNPFVHAYLEDCALPWHGPHGVSHWSRVLENGLRLAEQTGANAEIVGVGPMKPLYLADRGTPGFDQARTTIDVVCAGDSITGWNNFGPADSWPYPTYPQFFQGLCRDLGLTIADCGIAGEISGNGVGQVRDYLDLFPDARYFIIGYGTNDLGTWPDAKRTSQRIIENLAQMVDLARAKGKQPVLFNVPYANESMFVPFVAEDLHAKRDYHNARLKGYCGQQGIPLADVCSHLHDEHLGDELHPSEAGARIIAMEVFKVLAAVHKEL